MRHLFFWKGMENASFKKVDGGYLYFPWGVLGSGYQVSDAKKAEIAKFTQQFYLIATLIMVAGILAQWLLIAFIPLVIYFLFKVRGFTTGLPRSEERMAFSENQQAVARTISKARIYFILGCGIVLTAVSVFITWLSFQPGGPNFWIGLACTIFFGTCLLMAFNLLRVKQRSMADQQ